MYTFSLKEVTMEVNVKTARSKLSEILNRVEKGEEVTITRRGAKIATLFPPVGKQHLPSLKEFRNSIQAGGPPLSQAIVNAIEEERY